MYHDPRGPHSVDRLVAPVINPDGLIDERKMFGGDPGSVRPGDQTSSCRTHTLLVPMNIPQNGDSPAH